MSKAKSEAIEKAKYERVGGMGGHVIRRGKTMRGFGETYKTDTYFKHGKKVGYIQTKKRHGRVETHTGKGDHAVQGADEKYLLN